MKVVFLDVDGVLNKQDNFNPALNLGPYPVDDYCVFLMGKIQLDTDCSIVVSSSWRHHADGMNAIRAKFNNVIDKTGTSSLIDYNDKPRGHEIQTWLDEHSEVTKYAILDDDSDMLSEQLPSFFQTTFKTGLTEDIAKRVTEYLNAPN